MITNYLFVLLITSSYNYHHYRYNTIIFVCFISILVSLHSIFYFVSKLRIVKVHIISNFVFYIRFILIKEDVRNTYLKSIKACTLPVITKMTLQLMQWGVWCTVTHSWHQWTKGVLKKLSKKHKKVSISEPPYTKC